MRGQSWHLLIKKGCLLIHGKDVSCSASRDGAHCRVFRWSSLGWEQLGWCAASTGPGFGPLAKLLVGKAILALLFLSTWICSDFPSSGRVGRTNKGTTLASAEGGSLGLVLVFIVFLGSLPGVAVVVLTSFISEPHRAQPLAAPRKILGSCSSFPLCVRLRASLSRPISAFRQGSTNMHQQKINDWVKF